MSQRDITLDMIMECVEFPDYVYPQHNGTTLLRKRIKVPGADFIVIISKKEGNKITIITSYII